MPAKSVSQQRLFGLVHAIQEGKVDPSKVSKNVRQMAQSIKKDDVMHFAETSHEGLPDHVKTAFAVGFVKNAMHHGLTESEAFGLLEKFAFPNFNAFMNSVGKSQTGALRQTVTGLRNAGSNLFPAHNVPVPTVQDSLHNLSQYGAMNPMTSPQLSRPLNPAALVQQAQAAAQQKALIAQARQRQVSDVIQRRLAMGQTSPLNTGATPPTTQLPSQPQTANGTTFLPRQF